MTTIYSQIKDCLDANTDARERRYRDKYLLRMTMKKLGREGMTIIPLSEAVDFAKTYDSYRHEWDAVTRDCEYLRGSDYADKKRLSQEKQMEYGYTPMFEQDIKRSKQLSL